VSKFIEFPGAQGPVYINAECIAQISVGGPQPAERNPDVFYHVVRSAFREDHEGLIDEFWIDYDCLPKWLEYVREVLGVPMVEDPAEFEEGPAPPPKERKTDVQDTENRGFADCPVCGEVHTECNLAVLDGMVLRTWVEAKRRLSPEGMEFLRMMDYSGGMLPGGVIEALENAAGFADLPPDEQKVLEIYFARMTLIVTTREKG
jgi:hypothetical protein